MSYTILSAKQLDDMIITVVEYDIDGEKVQVSVPHFQPQSKEEVKLGLANRFASEADKKEAAQKCADIISELELNQVVDI